MQPHLNESNKPRLIPLLWPIAALAIAALILIAVVIVRSDWSPLGNSWPGNPSPPPRVSLSVLIDGQAVHAPSGRTVNVVVGATLMPDVDVDWGSHRPVSVRLTLDGKEIQNGAPILMRTLGVSTLLAEISADGWTATDSMTFETTAKPRHVATATVHHISNDCADEMAIDVRLASSEFNIENIYLSHVTLWLLDDSNLTLDRLSVASLEADGPGDPEYQARFQDGHWIIHFSRPGDAAPPNPARIMVTGSGWEGDQHIEFATEPTPFKQAHGRDG